MTSFPPICSLTNDLCVALPKIVFVFTVVTDMRVFPCFNWKPILVGFQR